MSNIYRKVLCSSISITRQQIYNKTTVTVWPHYFGSTKLLGVKTEIVCFSKCVDSLTKLLLWLVLLLPTSTVLKVFLKNKNSSPLKSIIFQKYLYCIRECCWNFVDSINVVNSRDYKLILSMNSLLQNDFIMIESLCQDHFVSFQHSCTL